jgi:hypothetical protein
VKVARHPVTQKERRRQQQSDECGPGHENHDMCRSGERVEQASARAGCSPTSLGLCPRKQLRSRGSRHSQSTWRVPSYLPVRPKLCVQANPCRHLAVKRFQRTGHGYADQKRAKAGYRHARKRQRAENR